MNGVPVDDILGGVDDLPSLPAVVMELLGSIDQEDIDIGVLAKKVSNDPALTAKTLRLANSSAFGLQVKATTIQQAMTFLGFQATRNLITAAALTGCFPAGRCPGFNDKAFWRHSIATAACARVLARRVRFNPDYAFTAGLLHDIGRLVLVARFPDRYQAVLSLRDKKDCELIEAERELLGVDHVDAGVALAAHWNFSDTMRQAIAFHHTPEAAGAGFLATIVHVASAVVHALDLAGNPDDLAPRVSAVAWTALGMTEQAWLQAFHETELQYEEMTAILMA
ncbi:HDOD domain-containing protein [Massilia yuzhufengensis]|uniref:HDIG domain-containing protein n=1 Tax=Massilia yuzhufengensis TaxID=1164594 RepID=A0A1I1TZE7_9BURK|nr:HDOD domain-containing protein [Massilia yuzhufengensis]SFD63991.1 HDIG domain-containing protein [Massilia yuzhufengensis]